MIFLLLCCQQVKAQDSSKKYKGYVLSSVVIADLNNGFDVDKFITRVQRDSTFYKAFKTLSLVGFTQYNDIRFYTKSGKTKDYYSSISRQEVDGKCRTMQNSDEKYSKGYYTEKGKPRHITSKFYERLFMIDEKTCGEDNIVNGKLSADENKRINQLKELVFKPGESIQGVPGVGAKVGIFEDERKEQYNFSIEKVLYNGDWCYVFKAAPKKEFEKNNVINYLNSWVRIKDKAIVQRKYSLSYKTLLYDFNVQMDVKLKTLKDLLVPYEVYYKGNWHFLGKKREIAEFTTLITDFK